MRLPMNWKLFLSILKFDLGIQIRTKSFWVISMIPPVAMVLMFVLNFNSAPSNVVLVDNQTSLTQPIAATPTMNVIYGAGSDWKEKGYDAYVRLTPSGSDGILCEISSENVFSSANQISIMDNLVSKLAEKNLGITLSDAKALESGKVQMKMNVENARYRLSFIAPVAMCIVYLLVFQFAGSILKLTGREKSSKICEIFLSAMSPRVILAAKLVACLVAAFLQIAVWVLASVVLIFLLDAVSIINIDHEAIDSIRQAFAALPDGQLSEFICLYLLFLTGGFILYCAMYSVIGAISNENTNPQQFTSIVSLPLVIAFLCIIRTEGADTPLLDWLSYIPFTSPIASVIVAINSGLSLKLVVSALILYATAFLMYRWCCVLYAKGALASNTKVTFDMLFKWLTKRDNAE